MRYTSKKSMKTNPTSSGANSPNEVDTDLIHGIRCCLIESGGEVGGECRGSFTRKK